VFLSPYIESFPLDKVLIVYEDRPEPISLYGNQEKQILKDLPDKYQKRLVKLSEIIDTKQKLKILFSIHPYIIDLFVGLAEFNIRLSYSIGKNMWQFGDINTYYDLILTQGKYSSFLIETNHGVTCMEVGYPRYFDLSSSNQERVKKHFQNSSLPLISFFPTLGSKCILLYQQNLIDNIERFNFVVKVHPVESFELIKFYNSLNPRILVLFDNNEQNISNQDVMLASDLVIHDYGGTCFSSLYLKRNIAFFPQTFDQEVNVIKLSAENLLYLLLKRNIDNSFFADSLNSLISNPLKYEGKVNQIRNIFMNDKTDLRIKDIEFFIRHHHFSVRPLKKILAKFRFRKFYSVLTEMIDYSNK
jgi:hypothetical protein